MIKKYDLTENFNLMDGRLALCTLSVLVSGICLVYDYFFPHPLSRNVMIVCVLFYLFLSCLLTLYMMFIEQSIFFVGTKKDKKQVTTSDKWTFSSVMKKYDKVEIY